MLRSLYAGVSGVKGHQTYLDVTGNNIANVNTVGFRKSVVSFQDLLYQNNRGAMAGNAENGYGGTNPMQVGLGVAVGAIETIQSQGPLQYTGNRNDMAIQGDGFFVVTSGQQKLYTRSGAAVLDDKGNLTMSGTGYLYQGYKYVQDSTDKTKFVASGAIEGINIPMGEKLEPEVTSLVGYRCNLNSQSKPYIPRGLITNDSQVTVNLSGGPYVLDKVTPGAVTMNGATGNINSTDFLTISDGGGNTIKLAYAGVDTNSGLPKLIPTVSGLDKNGIGTPDAKYDSTTGTLTITDKSVPPKSQKIELASMMDFVRMTDSAAVPSESFLVAFRPANDGTGNMQMEWWPESVPNPALAPGTLPITPPLPSATVSPTTGTVIAIPTNPDGTFNFTDASKLLPNSASNLTSAVASAEATLLAAQQKANDAATVMLKLSTAGTGSAAVAQTAAAAGSVNITTLSDFNNNNAGVTQAQALTAANDIRAKVATALADANAALASASAAGDSIAIAQATAAQVAATAANTQINNLIAIVQTHATPPLAPDPALTAAIAGITTDTGAVVTAANTAQTSANNARNNTNAGGTSALNNALIAYNAAVSAVIPPAPNPVTATYSLSTTPDGKGIAIYKDAVSVGTVNQRVDGTHPTKLDIYDSLGNAHTLEVLFEKLDNNRWGWRAYLPTEPGIAVRNNVGTIEFGADGLIKGSAEFSIDINFAIIGAGDSQVKLDFSGKSFNEEPLSGVTQFGSPTTTKAFFQDGYTMGVLQDYALGGDGTITAVYSNGQRRPLYQVALALFSNPQGLNKEGNSVFSESANSGNAQIGKPKENGAGILQGSTLEMANVDLSEEFVRLIVAQRGFQANARVVTTSDQVLEELINLKR